MAVRPHIRPRQRVIATAAAPVLSAEVLADLPRVLLRVTDCGEAREYEGVPSASRQPKVLRPAATGKVTKSIAKSEGSQSASMVTAESQPAAGKPTLPAFWQSRKVIVAAGIIALVSAIAIGYQFRSKQQIIVVHPAKQPATVAASPANNNAAKPVFQPLAPATPTTGASKETTSTASLMPRATWPAEKTPSVAPTKPATSPAQTATKPVDTRTSLYSQPATPMQENLPRMSPQFPQTTNPVSNTPANSAMVYNPNMNAAPSPLASGYANQNNLLPQNGSLPQYTAAVPNYQPNHGQPSQPMASPDGSFGAYGSARFEGQIQPLPIRR